MEIITCVEDKKKNCNNRQFRNAHINSFTPSNFLMNKPAHSRDWQRLQCFIDEFAQLQVKQIFVNFNLPTRPSNQLIIKISRTK